MRTGIMKFVKLNGSFVWMLMRESQDTRSMGHFWALLGSFGRYGFLFGMGGYIGISQIREKGEGCEKTNRA